MALSVCLSLVVASISGAAPASAYTPSNDYVAYKGYQSGNLDEMAHFSQYGTSVVCKFAGNSGGMVSQSGDFTGYSCANQNITEGNWGYPSSPYKYVHLYYGAWYSGAYACIYPGYYWEMGGIFSGVENYGNLTFNHGITAQGQLPGYQQPIWYNVASMSWEKSC